MNIGLCVNSNAINKYSKPFIVNMYPDNTFIAQIIRDIDFSFYVKYNEKLEISVIIYPSKTSYYDANLNNSNPNIFTIIGTYNIIFDEISNKSTFNDSIKGTLTKLLNTNLNIELTFNIILDKTQKNDTYIFSTPFLNGNTKYLQKTTICS